MRRGVSTLLCEAQSFIKRSDLRRNRGLRSVFVTLLNILEPFLRKPRNIQHIPQKHRQRLMSRYSSCGETVESCGKLVEISSADVESMGKRWGKKCWKIRNAKSWETGLCYDALTDFTDLLLHSSIHTYEPSERKKQWIQRYCTSGEQSSWLSFESF